MLPSATQAGKPRTNTGTIGGSQQEDAGHLDHHGDREGHRTGGAGSSNDLVSIDALGAPVTTLVVVGEPVAVEVVPCLRDARAQRRAVEWLLEQGLIDDAGQFAADHPDPAFP